MRGVLLTGGEGTRMYPASRLYNKHIALVYEKPAIYYPLKTLGEMGCSDVTIISSRTGIGDIAKYVGDGSEFELGVNYKVQPDNTGTSQALAQAEVSGVFPFMLGDCYYDPAPPVQDEATLYWTEYPKSTEHSIWNPEANAIIEKPKFVDLGRRAVVSYLYDDRIFEFIEQQKPTEIVDLHNFYRQAGAQILEYTGFFGDMGTPEGLLRVANHIKEKP